MQWEKISLQDLPQAYFLGVPQIDRNNIHPRIYDLFIGYWIVNNYLIENGIVFRKIKTEVIDITITNLFSK